MITPDQIEKKEFTVRRVRGYDPGEVDDFLDDVVDSYREALNQLQAAKVEASRLRTTNTQQFAPVQSAAPEAKGIGDVSRLLALAQQAADQQAAEATAAANAKLADTDATARGMLADAQRQADAIIAQGNSKRNEIVGELEVKRTELQNNVNSLNGELTAVRDRLTAALNATNN